MKIALAFSGGGYRASAYSLGTLTYLKHLKFNNEPLLNSVEVLSTVSGGTITGSRYAVGIKKGETLDDIYKSLYKFFLDVDLVTKSIESLSSKKNEKEERVISLINEFADIYDEQLFNGEKFGVLFNEENPIHLKHIAFNATEFVTGLQFQFLLSEKIVYDENGKLKSGYTGNWKHRIPAKIVKHIRMADILAASSCFPGAFEPINFPTDFVFEDKNVLKGYRGVIAMMDGGIVDNQGVESIRIAENIMKKNASEKADNSLDLIILSDVSSPYMKRFTASKRTKKRWLSYSYSWLTINKINFIAAIIAFASALGVVLFSRIGSIIGVIILTSMSTFFLITLVALNWSIYCIKKAINKKMHYIDLAKLKSLLSINFGKFEGLLKNRIKSVAKLVGSVFMKTIRQLNYEKVYEDIRWKNRRVMSAIYELKDENEREDPDEYEYLQTSEEIKRISKKVFGMSTTLWFEKKHLKDDMLNKLIACGQYNLCWNLLDYVLRIKEDKDNTNEHHKQLVLCEKALREDWGRFNEDPLWLVNKYNRKLELYE